MSVGTVLSRLTGVVRLAVLAAALGITETRLTDTYNLANTVPNIVYELVLGGVIGAIFIPLFVELRENETRERAWEVFSSILNVCLLALSAIALLGVIASPWIARFYASRLAGPEVAYQEDAIGFLLPLFIPQIVLYGLYFISAAMLNAHKRFGPPMWTPIINNVVAIAVFVVFALRYDAVSLATVTNEQLLLLGLGTTASVAPMGLALLPYLRRLGAYRFRIKLDHPSLRKLARLSVFVIGFVVANQIGYVITQWLANREQGGYTAYVAAFSFFLLPMGLFMWSLTTALMPGLSELALGGDEDGFRDRVVRGVGATLFLMLPSAVGYVILGRPVVEILLEHGVVTARSTEVVVGVLRLLALGLVQFALFELFCRAFYARQDAKTPFYVNCGVILLNIAINIAMFSAFGVEGLAAGHALAYTGGAIWLAFILRRRLGALGGRALVVSALRSAAAAAIMGLLVAAALWAVRRLMPDGELSTLVEVLFPVTVGAVAFVILARVLRIDEFEYLKELVVRRKPA